MRAVRDLSFSAVVSGFVAVLVGFSSSAVIVLPGRDGPRRLTRREGLVDARAGRRDRGHVDRAVDSLPHARAHRMVDAGSGAARHERRRRDDASGDRRVHGVRRVDRPRRRDRLVRARHEPHPRDARRRHARRRAAALRARGVRLARDALRARGDHAAHLPGCSALLAALRDSVGARRRHRGGRGSGSAARRSAAARTRASGVRHAGVHASADRQRRAAAVRRHDGVAKRPRRRRHPRIRATSRPSRRS